MPLAFVDPRSAGGQLSIDPVFSRTELDPRIEGSQSGLLELLSRIGGTGTEFTSGLSDPTGVTQYDPIGAVGGQISRLVTPEFGGTGGVLGAPAPVDEVARPESQIKLPQTAKGAEGKPTVVKGPISAQIDIDSPEGQALIKAEIKQATEEGRNPAFKIEGKRLTVGESVSRGLERSDDAKVAMGLIAPTRDKLISDLITEGSRLGTEPADIQRAVSGLKREIAPTAPTSFNAVDEADRHIAEFNKYSETNIQRALDDAGIRTDDPRRFALAKELRGRRPDRPDFAFKFKQDLLKKSREIPTLDKRRSKIVGKMERGEEVSKIDEKLVAPILKNQFTSKALELTKQTIANQFPPPTPTETTKIYKDILSGLQDEAPKDEVADPRAVEGAIITNPKTGQKMILKGGKWQAI